LIETHLLQELGDNITEDLERHEARVAIVALQKTQQRWQERGDHAFGQRNELAGVLVTDKIEQNEKK
jgi:aromatic ring-opening dioxygenase LigB subunit